jgi:hypothetical protein
MWYASGSGRGIIGAIEGTTKLAARRFLLKR